MQSTRKTSKEGIKEKNGKNNHREKRCTKGQYLIVLHPSAKSKGSEEEGEKRIRKTPPLSPSHLSARRKCTCLGHNPQGTTMHNRQVT